MNTRGAVFITNYVQSGFRLEPIRTGSGASGGNNRDGRGGFRIIRILMVLCRRVLRIRLVRPYGVMETLANLRAMLIFDEVHSSRLVQRDGKNAPVSLNG